MLKFSDYRFVARRDQRRSQQGGRTLSWTRTDYFTYFTDENTQTSHRAGDQVWNFTYPGDRRQYTIWISGNNPQNGMHNAFAKKHLLTVNGGKSEGLETKLATLHEKRQTQEIDEYNALRAKKASKFTGANQQKFPIKALGGQGIDAMATSVDHTSKLSVVVCDLIEPKKLKYAFAKALSTANLVANQATHHIVVNFGDNQCVRRHDFATNETTETNQITISAYCVAESQFAVTAHIVHCSG